MNVDQYKEAIGITSSFDTRIAVIEYTKNNILRFTEPKSVIGRELPAAASILHAVIKSLFEKFEADERETYRQKLEELN